jgi:hypothetical protein
MAALADIIAQARRVDSHRPWQRAIMTPEAWRAVAAELAAGHATLLGLWGDSGAVHMAVMNEAGHDINVVSVECRPPSGSSVRSKASTGSSRSARRIRGHGSISVFGMCNIR